MNALNGIGLSRRAWCHAMLAGGLLLWAPPAWGGSYLDRATLLVSQAVRESEFLRLRLADRELARTVHKLAAARLKAASTMQVPTEVAQAHPHLLLMLEHYERATDAARQGETGRFFEHLGRARDEEAILRAVLKQLGWPLPKR